VDNIRDFGPGGANAPQWNVIDFDAEGNELPPDWGNGSGPNRGLPVSKGGLGWSAAQVAAANQPGGQGPAPAPLAPAPSLTALATGGQPPAPPISPSLGLQFAQGDFGGYAGGLGSRPQAAAPLSLMDLSAQRARTPYGF
jgi:hypothetical protein